MFAVSLNGRERHTILAALDYLRRGVDHSHLLEGAAGGSSEYPDVPSIAASDESEALPTAEELQELESKLSGASRSEPEVPMWTVVVLRGGLLESLYVSQHESMSRNRFDVTCRLLKLPPDDPCDEDYEVYHDKLARVQDEYSWE